MINEVIAKFIEGGHLAKNAVKIEFKKRNTILGIFVQSPDYEDLKSKNFWRHCFRNQYHRVETIAR